MGQSDEYWVAAANFADAVQALYRFPVPLTIYDSTVRKILLTPGLNPTPERMLRVVDALERIGVKEMLLNLFWWGEREPETLHLEVARAVLARKFAVHTSIYLSLGNGLSPDTVSTRQALAVARDLGADTVEVAVPVPLDADQMPAGLERVDELAELARSHELHLALGLHDAPRRAPEHVIDLARRGASRGCGRIALTDSCSSLAPEAMRHWGAQMCDELNLDVPVSMHAHNDFGLGTALAVAAASAGMHPEVSVNNLSYRGGFAAFEEVVLALELLYGVPTGIDLSQLTALSQTVSRQAGLTPHPIKAVTGAHAFVRDQPGAMLQYLRDGANAFLSSSNSYSARLVGARTKIVWSTHPSPEVVREKLRRLNIEPSDRMVDAVQDEVDALLITRPTYPHWVTEPEFDAICRNLGTTQ